MQDLRGCSNSQAANKSATVGVLPLIKSVPLPSHLVSKSVSAVSIRLWYPARVLASVFVPNTTGFKYCNRKKYCFLNPEINLNDLCLRIKQGYQMILDTAVVKISTTVLKLSIENPKGDLLQHGLKCRLMLIKTSNNVDLRFTYFYPEVHSTV